MNVINILNTIRANSSQMYQDRIPVATTSNLEDIGTQVLTYEAIQNEFVGALVNKIAFVEVSSRRYTNPLAVLKSGNLPFGNSWEEVHTNPAKDIGPATKENEVSGLLSTQDNDVATIYHELNRKGVYKVSVSYTKLQTAFKGLHEMEAFIQDIINQMYSGDEVDEFKLMKDVVADAIKNNYIVKLPVAFDGKEETSKELIKLVKTLSHDFTEPSLAYNGYNLVKADDIEGGKITGRITWTPRDNQVILIRSDVDACTDVEVLAKAFNMDKVEFNKRKFVVSSFGDPKVLAVLTDDKFFKFRDVVYTVKKDTNGYSLVDNYFLHHYQVISVSLFANAVAIVEEDAAQTTSDEPETLLEE